MRPGFDRIRRRCHHQGQLICPVATHARLTVAHFTHQLQRPINIARLIAAPVAYFLPFDYVLNFGGWSLVNEAPWLLPLASVAGILLLFATLHLARGIGKLHGLLAKHLLVRNPVV